MKTSAPLLNLDDILPVLIHAWRKLTRNPGPADRLQTREFRQTVAAIKTFQEMSSNGRSLLGQDYFSDANSLGAYLLYPWVIHYQEAFSILGEIPAPLGRVLDVCSGPAPMALAALKRGATEVIAIDRNLKALEVGADICGRSGHCLSIRQWSSQARSLPVPGTFDTIILGHCLTELFPSPDQQGELESFVFHLMNKLSPHGFLVVIDSSFPQQNQRILALRDAAAKGNIPIQAPCVWRGDCPVRSLPNSPCYAQRELEKPFLIKELQRAAEINLSSLKMSYLILRHKQAAWPKLPDEKLYRIISPPVDSFHGKRHYVCGVDGKKSLGTRLEKHPPESKAYEFMKRGELISIENPLDDGRFVDVTPNTKLKVVAACGKPIKE